MGLFSWLFGSDEENDRQLTLEEQYPEFQTAYEELAAQISDEQLYLLRFDLNKPINQAAESHNLSSTDLRCFYFIKEALKLYHAKDQLLIKPKLAYLLSHLGFSSNNNVQSPDNSELYKTANSVRLSIDEYCQAVSNNYQKEYYLKAIDDDYFPIDLKLNQNEFVLKEVPAFGCLFQSKKVVDSITYGGIRSQNSLGDGLSFTAGSFTPKTISHEAVRFVTVGDLYITNQRVIFVSPDGGKTFRFNNILSIDPITFDSEVDNHRSNLNEGIAIVPNNGRTLYFGELVPLPSDLSGQINHQTAWIILQNCYHQNIANPASDFATLLGLYRHSHGISLGIPVSEFEEKLISTTRSLFSELDCFFRINSPMGPLYTTIDHRTLELVCWNNARTAEFAKPEIKSLLIDILKTFNSNFGRIDSLDLLMGRQSLHTAFSVQTARKELSDLDDKYIFTDPS